MKKFLYFIFMVIVRFVSAPGYDNIGLMSEFMSDRFHFVIRLKHGEFYCRYKPDLCLTSGYAMRVAWLIDKTASTIAISKRRYSLLSLVSKRNVASIIRVCVNNDILICQILQILHACEHGEKKSEEFKYTCFNSITCYVIIGIIRIFVRFFFLLRI